MVESVSATEAYQEFEKRNNRLINMLADNVRVGDVANCGCEFRTGISGGKGLRGSGNP
jgi:hypothetical protein